MTGFRQRVGLRWVIGLCAGLVFLTGGTVQAVPPGQQQGFPIRYGDVVQGRLNDANDSEWWTFEGQSGDLVLINMQASTAGNLDTVLTLTDDQDNTLATDDDSGTGFNSLLGPFELPDDGRYVITASRYGGDGEYRLELVNLLTYPAAAPGKPLVGVLNSMHTSEYFLLSPDLVANTPYRVAVSDDDRFSDPILSLHSVSGWVTSSDNQDISVIDPFVPAPGDSTIVAVTWNPASVGGRYELVVSESTIELLGDGIPQTGTLDYEVIRRRHYFQAQAGDVIRLDITKTGGDISPVMDVRTIDYDFYLLSTRGATLYDASLRVRIPRTTMYVIEVADQSQQTNTGGYTLTLTWE
ncbi:MAG: PPC domain-containing protein [Anaerolineae bacterium]|nr:PPC domain-containing protein [Anaerolineae bacterium]